MIKEHNDKKYREIQTVEEAEKFRGKTVRLYEGNGTVYETIYKITKFENGTIKLNKRTVEFLLTNGTIDGIPVGIEVVEPEFELPYVSQEDLDFFKGYIGISNIEAKIKRYIMLHCWESKIEWDGRNFAFAIYFNGDMWNCVKMTNKGMYLPIDTQDHASFICNNLNKLGVKP